MLRETPYKPDLFSQPVYFNTTHEVTSLEHNENIARAEKEIIYALFVKHQRAMNWSEVAELVNIDPNNIKRSLSTLSGEKYKDCRLVKTEFKALSSKGRNAYRYKLNE